MGVGVWPSRRRLHGNRIEGSAGPELEIEPPECLYSMPIYEPIFTESDFA